MKRILIYLYPVALAVILATIAGSFHAKGEEVVDPFVVDDCVVRQDDVWPIMLEHKTGYSVYTIIAALGGGMLFGAAIQMTRTRRPPNRQRAAPRHAASG